MVQVKMAKAPTENANIFFGPMMSVANPATGWMSA